MTAPRGASLHPGPSDRTTTDADGPAPHSLSLRILQLLAAAVFGATAVFFFAFTAEDAYITYRYAANFATLGSLVFNSGEPVLALTSPLHGVLASLLYRVTENIVLANKVLSFTLLCATGLLLLLRYRGRPAVQLLVAALALLPPSVMLWTFGGLETPVLLFLATALVLLASRPGPLDVARLCALLVLAGLAFLTRFDSVLFTAPLVLHVLWRAPSLRAAVLAVAVGAALPVAWIVVSLNYYGDIFPTSYYSKTPQRGLAVLIGNAKYIIGYLGFVGLLPVAALALWLHARRGSAAAAIQHGRQYWWLYAGIAAQLAYGLTMATTHMMFSFRFFVPYVPAAAILLGDLVSFARLPASEPEAPPRHQRLVLAGLLALVLFQAFQATYTYHMSVNGLARLGRYVEYGNVGVAEYKTFAETLRRGGEDSRRHWESLDGRYGRLPRIYTFAGGVLPFTFRESYVYETLVSYRHCTEQELQRRITAPNVWMPTTFDLRLSADYIHLVTPRHGELAPQLPLSVDGYIIVSSYEIRFDGALEQFLVLYNPTPQPHRLAARIDGGCSGEPAAAAASSVRE